MEKHRPRDIKDVVGNHEGVSRLEIIGTPTEDTWFRDLTASVRKCDRFENMRRVALVAPCVHVTATPGSKARGTQPTVRPFSRACCCLFACVCMSASACVCLYVFDGLQTQTRTLG